MVARAEKIIGYALLGAGLLFMLLAVYNVYTVFTGAKEPPAVFTIDSVILNVNNPSGGSNSVELVSGKVASKFMDMFGWYILMFFIAQAGGKIAGLGIQLIKEMMVTVKSKDSLTASSTE